MSFNREVRVTPSLLNCQEATLIELATTSPDTHMNLHVRKTKAGSSAYTCSCLMPTDAKALRDALIEAYPLEAVEPKDEYVIEECYGDHHVFHIQPSRVLVAACPDKSHAELLVEALKDK